MNTGAASFVLLIMNCQKYRHRASLQKEKWLNKMQSIPYYHVVGKPDMETTDDGAPYVFDEKECVLWTKTPDDYESLPKKVIASYDACIHNFPRLKYIFKTEDDQMCRIEDPNKFFYTLIASLISNTIFPSKYHYCGHVMEMSVPDLVQYCSSSSSTPHDLITEPPLQKKTTYCSGRFYGLSAKAIRYLLKKRHHIEKECVEDYAMGLHLHPRFKENIKNIAIDVFFADMPKEVVLQNISEHPF